MRSVAAALNHLAAREAVAIKVVLHPNPAVAETMSRAIAPCAAVELVAPLGHAEMIDAMRRADLLLSDSGGVQEEAPSLGKPVLVMRDTTERPEGVTAGTARLIGTDPQRIVAEVFALLDDRLRYDAMARAHNPFGDGKASARIAAIVAESG